MGNLFYAIAAADKKIRLEERNILHEEILYAWKHHDHSMDRRECLFILCKIF